MELSKRPTMESSLCVRMFLHPGTTTDVGQVLNHNGTARGGILDNPLGENVVMVFSLAQQFPAHLLEMSLCRAGAFCLKVPTQAEDTTFLLFPSSLPQEVLVGGDSRAVQAQVNPNHLLRWSNGRVRKRENNVQGIPSFSVAQIGTTHLATDVFLCIDGNSKGQFNTPSYRSKATGHALPLHPVGTRIIADWTDLRVWYTRLASLSSGGQEPISRLPLP